jgi:hypothetical protein
MRVLTVVGVSCRNGAIPLRKGEATVCSQVIKHYQSDNTTNFLSL